MAAPSDDRAFFAVPAGDGYLVVGSTRSIVVNTTVGWVLKLDENGNEVWNKTFLEGFGMELRYAVNLTRWFPACRQPVLGVRRRQRLCCKNR